MITDYTKDYISDLLTKISLTESSEEAADLSDQLDFVAGTLKAVRNSLPFESVKAKEILYAIDNDLEELESLAAKGSDEADTWVKHHENREAEEEEYGSYADQVRSQYNTGRL